MAETTVDFYELLGVPRDADPQVIRKAYFAKVRQFPPETHPEAFKRVREAYETIGNPQTRAQYDGTLAGGSAAAAAQEQLHVALAAWQAGDAARAEKTLMQLLLGRPDLTIARLLLARVFVAGGKVKQALPIFEALCREDAGNPLHHLHHGHAWRAAGDLDRALAAYQRAYLLDRTDPELLLAVADCLAERGEYEPALVELERGVQLDGKVDLEDLGYFLRKLQIQYLRGREDLADKELEQIMAVLPEGLETRRHVASRLLGITAGLFARKKVKEAQALIGWCRKIDPTRRALKMELPFEATLEISRLPTAARTWLRDTANDATAAVAMPVGKKRWLVAASFYVCISVYTAFGVHPVWDLAAKLSTGLHLVLAALAGQWLVQRLVLRRRSAYGSYLALHPFHLVRCSLDEVTVWPLFNLSSTSVLHHRHNGSYTHSLLTFEFAGQRVRFHLENQAVAEKLGQRALDQRRRLLELMAANELEKEAGHDVFPAALLEAGALARQAQERKRARLTRRAMAVAVGLVLFGLCIPYNRRATERFFYRAAETGGIPAQREYLRLYPDGTYADAVRGVLGERYAAILSEYRTSARAGAPGLTAVVALLGQLSAGPSSDVEIVYEAAVDLDGVSVGAGVIDPRPAFEGKVTAGRQASITAALKEALGKVIPAEALRIVEPLRPGGEAGRGPAAASFLVRYRIGSSGETYVERTSGKQLVGIVFEWTFSVRAGTDGAELASLSFRSSPAAHIEYSVSSGERDDPILPYEKMAESGFGDFQRRLISQLGIGPEVRDAEEADRPPARSPTRPPPVVEMGGSNPAAEEARRRIEEKMRAINAH